jgi:hypothetical protein
MNRVRHTSSLEISELSLFSVVPRNTCSWNRELTVVHTEAHTTLLSQIRVNVFFLKVSLPEFYPIVFSSPTHIKRHPHTSCTAPLCNILNVSSTSSSVRPDMFTPLCFQTPVTQISVV